MTEYKRFHDIGEFIAAAPIAPKWKVEALPLFLNTHDFWRILGFHYLYQQILDVHGDIYEFGVGHGRDLNILSCLRQMLEPNVPRRFIGFDTFTGVPEGDIAEIDGEKAEPGYCAPNVTPQEYIQFLEAVLVSHNPTHPSSDGSVFDIAVGRVQDTLPTYLDEHQGAIALAFIDLTVYDPTRFVMEAIKDRLPKGAILAFNQFYTPAWQHEARALREVFGLRAGLLRRNPYHRYWGHLVIE